MCAGAQHQHGVVRSRASADGRGAFSALESVDGVDRVEATGHDDARGVYFDRPACRASQLHLGIHKECTLLEV